MRDEGVILQGLSLEVYRGDFIAVGGVPGSGKTTLLSLVGLLDTPSAGSYLLNGQPVDALSDLEQARVRNKIFGFIFQTPAFITQLNVWQNVARPLKYAGVPKREQQERALALLGRLGLAERAHTRPLHLSLAEQQRVALARALVNEPEIILADEPTRHLSPTQQEVVLETLGAFNKRGGTVVLTTRDPEVAARAGKRYLLSQGQLQEVRTTPAEPDSRPPHEGLQLRVLGRAQVRYEARAVSLAPRQLDILTLLAAYPEGLASEQLLLLVYGDEGKTTTLKATLSRLRQRVPISNRPYRLSTACEADFMQLSKLLGRGEVAAAVNLYRGDLLPESDAPGIAELRETLSETLRQAVLASPDADAVFTLAETQRDDRELWEAALSALPAEDPRVALAKAQLKRVKQVWGE